MRFAAGELWYIAQAKKARNLCTSFELPKYVESHLPQGFKLLAFIPGTPEAHLRQDGYLLQWKIASMGNDVR